MTTANQVQHVDVGIIRRAIGVPVRQVAENPNAEGSVVVGKVRERTDFPMAGISKPAIYPSSIGHKQWSEAIGKRKH